MTLKGMLEDKNMQHKLLTIKKEPMFCSDFYAWIHDLNKPVCRLELFQLICEVLKVFM
jgi:hypothetical protein